jgi:hypothetical protein
LPDHAAIHGFNHTTLLVDPLQGIACRHRQQSTHRIVRQLAQQLVQIIATQVGPRSIVHQHPILIIRTQGMQVQQGIEHRSGTFGTAQRAECAGRKHTPGSANKDRQQQD